MKRSSVLIALSSVTCVSAFGPRIEPAYSFHGSSSSTAIRNTASERDEDEGRCRGVMALEHTYTLPPSGQSVFDLLYNQDGERIALKESFVVDDLSLLGLLEQYEESIAAEDDLSSCGADCDDCLIPEEFKRFPNDQPFDVMAYLGIKRAHPIQVTITNADSEFQ
ncbi:hypothetical protein MPSEU_000506100 [Mayamaea pseudoterrestris]|nr:hypothetical protein MPSEU_000506100 [Mayamaea pseudoterrestris]